MAEQTEGFTRLLAKFIVQTDKSDIPGVVYEHAKVAFLDWLGVTMAGKDEPLVLKLINLSEILGGEKQATVIGHKIKKNLTLATLINGAASHALDYDDTSRSFLGHPSVTLFPSLLTLAEWKGKNGKDFLTSYIVGFQAGCAVGACAGIEHYLAGWHSTSTIGHIASAAASCKLLSLEEQQTVQTIGIAATQACGLKSVFGTMCKPFHAGNASQAGLTAALLGSDDFSCSEDILEGPNGFFQAMKGQINQEAIDNLGKIWEVEALAQKYHASCHGTHSPIEAVLAVISKENISKDEIQSINIRCSELILTAAGNMDPKTGLEGKFSIPYCVANAVLTGETGTQAFSDKKVNDPDVKAFMKKITVVSDKDVNEAETPIEIKTVAGKNFSGFSNVINDVPPLDMKRKRIKAKFIDLCAPVTGDSRAEEIADIILSLEDLENMQLFINKL